MNILINNVLHRGEVVDVEIRDGKFSRIESGIALDSTEGYRVIDGEGKAILPPFYNGHCHAAMVLLRGYADDMDLFEWLNNYIWPMENKFTPADVCAGVKLAIVEMLRSGSVFFNDMYWYPRQSAEVIKAMGVRASIGVCFIDTGNQAEIEEKFALMDKMLEEQTSRVKLTVAPHAIYTVPAELYVRCKNYAREHGLIMHTHLAETQKEFDDSMEKYGMTPVQYLDSLGVLDENTVAAHCVHLTDRDIEILAERRVVVVHNPCSNMKLASGHFKMDALLKAGCRVVLGTDGASSNNNLSMMEEMRFAALLAKHCSDPVAVNAQNIFDCATTAGAEAFGLNGGKIEVGADADAILVDMRNERLVPCHNLVSDMVYSADSASVDTVICDGRVLMESREVEGLDAIIDEVMAVKARLF